MIELNNKNVKKILLIITFAIGLYAAFQNIQIVGNILGTILKIIFPFILGLCIAFVLNIPVRVIERIYYRLTSKKQTKGSKKAEKSIEKLQSRKVNIPLRLTSIILSILIIFFILYFVMFLVIPELVNTFNIFKQNIPNIADNIKNWLVDMTCNYPDIKEKIASISIDWSAIEGTLTDIGKGGLTVLVTSSVNIIISVFTGLFNLIMGFVFALYILLQKEKLLSQLRKVVLAYLPKERVTSIFEFGRVTNDTFSKFIGGQFLEACILGGLCFVGMSLFGFPYAAAISVLIGVTALVPFFGAFIGVVVGTILIFAINPTQAFWFIIFFIVLQQVEGNLIYPRVVGNSVGLPAIWVILAVTIGGSLFGVVGMLIGVPFVSVIYKTLRKNVNKKLKNKEMQ